MKKILAILMALTVCGAVAYSAVSAEDVEDVDDVVVVEEAADEAEDVLGALVEDEKAQEIAGNIADAIANGATADDVTSLMNSLAKYVNGKGFDVSDLQDGGAVRDVLDQFLTDAGVDTEALNDAIANSSIASAALELYYKPTTTVPEEPTEPDVPTTSIPDTGFMF